MKEPIQADHPDHPGRRKSMAAKHPIERVRRLATRIKDTEAALAAAVIVARNAGFTWLDIGSALVMTKQSAWEKYHAAVSGAGTVAQDATLGPVDTATVAPEPSRPGLVAR
jgi:hypothetical protein